MYTKVTEDFKKAVQGKAVISTAKMIMVNPEKTIDGSKLKEVTINDKCYDNGQLIGTAMCKEAEISIINKNNEFSNLNDQEFNLQIGVQVPYATQDINASGKELILTNPKENYPFKSIKVKGETKQDISETSPSPDYRSPIENVEGKNKFDKNNMVEATWDNGKTNTVTLLEDGRIQSTANYAQWAAKCIDIPNLKANTDYVVSGKIISSTADNAMIIVKGYKNNTLSNIIYRRYAVGTRFELSFNSSDYEKIGISLSGENSTLDTTYTTIFDEIQLEEGTVATDYVQYNSLEIKDVGKNLLKISEIQKGRLDNGVLDYANNTTSLNIIDNTVTFTVNHTYRGVVTDFIEVKPNTTYIFSQLESGDFYRDVACYNSKKEFISNKSINSIVTPENCKFIRIQWLSRTVDTKTITSPQLEESTVATPYEPYKEQKVDFPLSEGQKLMEGSYLADDGIHHSRKQVVFDGSREYIRYTSLDSTNHNCFYTNQSDIYVDSTGTQTCLMSNYFKGDKFDNRALDIPNMWVNKFSSQIYFKVPKTITTVEELTTLFAEQYANGTPVIVVYELAEEEIVPYTEEQQEAREKLRHFKGLNGENNITAQGTMTSTLDLTLYNVAEEDFDIYISKKGYFGALKYDINNLIDFMESNIPSIAEATESSVKIAGRDGDISLNTVYEPLPFEIVCYTEDNLTPEEKIIEEQKITSLLNSIKNQTKTFFMEREKKFYKVKYSGNLSVVRYPKHLKFTIPLKSSESYAMNYEESEIIGNGTKVSNTIKDTGAIFTIKGPATKPIISLNNYQMKYNENILEGNSLIINSEDSTITHITSAGVKTNAMRAYNHEFPKIKNGENQLAVSSGIDDEKQVNVKWYDLKI